MAHTVFQVLFCLLLFQASHWHMNSCFWNLRKLSTQVEIGIAITLCFIYSLVIWCFFHFKLLQRVVAQLLLVLLVLILMRVVHMAQAMGWNGVVIGREIGLSSCEWILFSWWSFRYIIFSIWNPYHIQSSSAKYISFFSHVQSSISLLADAIIESRCGRRFTNKPQKLPENNSSA